MRVREGQAHARAEAEREEAGSGAGVSSPVAQGLLETSLGTIFEESYAVTRMIGILRCKLKRSGSQGSRRLNGSYLNSKTAYVHHS